jgi:hypothetical protein
MVQVIGLEEIGEPCILEGTFSRSIAGESRNSFSDFHSARLPLDQDILGLLWCRDIRRLNIQERRKE